MTETKQPKRRPRRTKKTSPTTKLLPQWRVLLHNDAVNKAIDVVHHVQQIMHWNEQDAAKKVQEAHENDIALLTITHKERAELYCELFASCLPQSVTVTAEAV